MPGYPGIRSTLKEVQNMKVIVRFAYTTQNNNVMRQGAIVLTADKKEAAIKAASDQLAKQYDWFKVTSAVEA